METKEITTKDDFKKLFDQAMKENKAYDGYSTFEIEPALVIRDFKNSEDLKPYDKEFTDLNEAWVYFQKVGVYSRVMANNGVILADYY